VNGFILNGLVVSETLHPMIQGKVHLYDRAGVKTPPEPALDQMLQGEMNLLNGFTVDFASSESLVK
jgi:hypothetical protein